MTQPYPQLVLLGDSLLQFCVDIQDGYSFQAALQTYLSRRVDVVNRGFSGYNTRNVIKYIDEIFPEPTASSAKLKYLVILLGTNDSAVPLPTKAQHTPIEDFKANLVKIINHPNIQAHKPKILLVTPPPVDEIKRTEIDVGLGHASATRKSAVTAAYAEKVRDVAKEHPGVELVDLWQAIMDKAISLTPNDYQPGGPWLGSPENGKQGGLVHLLPDGIHLSGLAYKVFYDTLLPFVGREWAHLAADDRTGYIYPDWKVLNPEPAL